MTMTELCHTKARRAWELIGERSEYEKALAILKIIGANEEQIRDLTDRIAAIQKEIDKNIEEERGV